MTTEPELIAKEAPPNKRRLGVGAWIALAVALLAIAYVVYNGMEVRAAASERLVHATDQAATPVVSVVHPLTAAPTQEIVLPGNTQAFIDSPIYARTSGYLKQWNFDIGARVKKGDLLAEIETPEVDQQLQQARADLETAQATQELAQTTADRWRFLLKVEFGFETRDRPGREQPRGAKSHRGFPSGRHAPPGTASIVREGHGAIRWRHYGSQYGRWRAD